MMFGIPPALAGAEDSVFPDIAAGLAEFKRSLDYSFAPSRLDDQTIGFWSGKERDPAMMERGRVDYEGVVESLTSLSKGELRGGQKEKAMYQLYKTLPHIQDVVDRKDTWLWKAWAETGAAQETAKLLDILPSAVGAESPVPRIDSPLGLKNAIVTALQKEQFLPDYGKAFEQADSIMESAILAFGELKGDEPPEVIAGLAETVKSVKSACEALGVQYATTLHAAGKKPISRDAYNELQQQIEKTVKDAVNDLPLAAVGEALPVTKDAVNHVLEDRDEKRKEALVSKASNYFDALVGTESAAEATGLSRLLGTKEPLRVSSDVLAQGEVGKRLNDLSEKILRMDKAFSAAATAYSEDYQAYRENWENLLKAMPVEMRQEQIKKLAQQAFGHMHEGHYLEAARAREAARIIEGSLGWWEGTKRHLSGTADLSEQVATALDALSNPAEYDAHYATINGRYATQREAKQSPAPVKTQSGPERRPPVIKPGGSQPQVTLSARTEKHQEDDWSKGQTRRTATQLRSSAMQAQHATGLAVLRASQSSAAPTSRATQRAGSNHANPVYQSALLQQLQTQVNAFNTLVQASADAALRGDRAGAQRYWNGIVDSGHAMLGTYEEWIAQSGDQFQPAERALFQRSIEHARSVLVKRGMFGSETASAQVRRPGAQEPGGVREPLRIIIADAERQQSRPPTYKVVPPPTTISRSNSGESPPLVVPTELRSTQIETALAHTPPNGSGTIHGRLWDSGNKPQAEGHVFVVSEDMKTVLGYAEIRWDKEKGRGDSGVYSIENLPTSGDAYLIGFSSMAKEDLAVQKISLDQAQKANRLARGLTINTSAPDASGFGHSGSAGGPVLEVLRLAGQVAREVNTRTGNQESERIADYLLAQKDQARSGGQLGGVEVGSAEPVALTKRIIGASVDQRTGRISFTARDGKTYEFDPVDPEIMDALLYLKAKYGDLTQLSFTLLMEREESERCKRALNEHYADHIEEYRKAARTRDQRWHPVESIAVKNRPCWIPGHFEYGNTIVGQIALQADVALKYLSSGLDPATHKRFDWSPDYHGAVETMTEDSFQRLWLYRKSAELVLNKRGSRWAADIDIAVGIKTKAIRYTSTLGAETEDIGEAPEYVKRCAAIMERDYDRIATRVPSWARLKEVYRGIALIWCLEALGAEFPEQELPRSKVRQFRTPETVPGLAAWSVEGLSTRTTVGGVNFSLMSKENYANDTQFYRELLKLAVKNNAAPIWRAAGHMMDWSLDEAIATCSHALDEQGDDWRVANLRGIARACKGMRVPKPSSDVVVFDVLQFVVGEDFTNRLVNLDARTLNWDTELLLAARADLEKATALNPLLPRWNLDVLNEVQQLPARKMLQQAIDEKDGARKMALHREAVDLFMLTGNYAEAAKRLEYLCYRRPDDPFLALEMVGAYLEAARGSTVREEDIPVVLVFPLRSVTGQADWLSKGLPFLLYEGSRGQNALRVLDPILLEEGMRLLKYTDKDLMESEEARRAVASLYGLRPDYMINGTFTKFGDALKVLFDICRREGNRTEKKTVDVRGTIKDPPKLVAELLADLSFEVAGKLPSQFEPTTIPASTDDLEIWCLTSVLRAQAEDADLLKYLEGESDSGRAAAVFGLAEYWLGRGEPKKARVSLSGHAATLEDDWRYWHLLGATHLAEGRTEDGCMCLRKALKLKPSSMPSMQLLASNLEDTRERGALNTRRIESMYFSPRPYMENAQIALDTGDVPECARLLAATLRQVREPSLELLDQIQTLWVAATEEVMKGQTAKR